MEKLLACLALFWVVCGFVEGFRMADQRLPTPLEIVVAPMTLVERLL